MGKLEARDRAQLVVCAYEAGLVVPQSRPRRDAAQARHPGRGWLATHVSRPSSTAGCSRVWHSWSRSLPSWPWSCHQTPSSASSPDWSSPRRRSATPLLGGVFARRGGPVTGLMGLWAASAALLLIVAIPAYQAAGHARGASCSCPWSVVARHGWHGSPTALRVLARANRRRVPTVSVGGRGATHRKDPARPRRFSDKDRPPARVPPEIIRPGWCVPRRAQAVPSSHGSRAARQIGLPGRDLPRRRSAHVGPSWTPE